MSLPGDDLSTLGLDGCQSDTGLGKRRKFGFLRCSLGWRVLAFLHSEQAEGALWTTGQIAAKLADSQ
jgi:hypothetical protein